MYKKKYASKPKKFQPKKYGKKAYKKQYSKASIPTLLSSGGSIELRRGVYDTTIFVNDAGELSLNRWDATPTSWLTNSTLQPDIGANLKQFGLAVDMNLDDFPSPREITGMFSQYKFGPTEFLITLLSGDSAVAYTGAPPNQVGTQAPGCPHVYWYYDSGDSDPPSNPLEVLERGNVRQQLLTNSNPIKITHTLRPQLMAGAPGAVAGEIFNAVFDKSPWLKSVNLDDSVENKTSHFGTHLYFRNFGGEFSQCRIKISAIQTFYLRYPR